MVLADQLEELFLPFLTGHVYKKFDNYGTLGKIAKPGAKAIGSLVEYRWKKRNFDFPIEYHILKKGKALMRALYPRRGCLTWKIEINLKPDGEELHVIQNSKLGKEKNPGVILIKVPDENKEIEVRMVDRC